MRELRVSGSAILTLDDIFDAVEKYTNMPDSLWPHQPFQPYIEAVLQALDEAFEGKCAGVLQCHSRQQNFMRQLVFTHVAWLTQLPVGIRMGCGVAARAVTATGNTA